FFQAEDGIRDFHVTGVQTCALPILVEQMLVTVVDALHGTRSISFQGHTIDFTPPYRRLPFLEALQVYGGLDATTMSDDDLAAKARSLGVEDVETMGRGKLPDGLFGERVEEDRPGPGCL